MGKYPLPTSPALVLYAGWIGAVGNRSRPAPSPTRRKLEVRVATENIGAGRASRRYRSSLKLLRIEWWWIWGATIPSRIHSPLGY